MRHGIMAGIAALSLAATVPAQEKAPVVLMWGEYLAAVNEREAPGTRSYLDNTAWALKAAGIGYEETKDSEVESGSLRGHKFAIFPYNAHLTPAEQDEIRRFVEAGGKLWASFTSDPVLDELLGVRVTGGLRAEYEGYFSQMKFTPDAPPWVPEVVVAASWGSLAVEPLEGTRVIATWADAEGRDTRHPALTMNAMGCYQAHVMLGGDTDRKGRLLLAVIGHYFPEVWQSASQRVLAGVAEVHGYGSWDAVRDALAAAKAAGRDTTAAEERFRTAEKADREARRLHEEGKYPQALARAEVARQALRAATYRLARTREGELRAVWMSGSGVRDWDAVMRDLAQGGINAVFPSLSDAGGADYESEVLPRSADYKRDELAACLEVAARHGIEVHPWRVNWRLSRGTPERVAQMREEGRLSAGRDGKEGDWLCPSDPGNYDLEVRAMVEVVEKYPVAGTHFDYIRYDGPNFCYCEKCRTNFQRDTGVQVEEWPRDVLAGRSHYAAFQDWRREQITRVVREVYRRAHELRPDIVVSAAVFSNWPSSRTSIGQDAAAWAEEGIVDLLMPMTYTNSNDALAQLTTQHVELTRGRAVLAEGIGAFSSHSQFTGPDQLIEQIETARSLGADGFCIFHYGASLKQGYLSALAEGCTAGATFTPMLRPQAAFKLDGDAEGEGFFRPGLPAEVELSVQARGPWGKPVAALEATPYLQGLDGRDLKPLGGGVRLAAGESHAWAVRPGLGPGAYRLAVRGTVRFDDGTHRPYICRSRPLRVLTQDEYELRQGRLPAPGPVVGKPRVGVLVTGYGGEGILAALGGMGEVEVVAVKELSAGVARGCQMLVVTQARGAAAVDDRVAEALRGWVAVGGGLLATHDAVGYRDHVPIAPAVCRGGVGHERQTEVVVADMPPVPAEYRGARLRHAFYDHIVLEAGEAGRVVVTDTGGKPVVVAGEIGKGRFVASGIAFGLNARTEDEEPAGDEAELLRQLILWLAARS